MDLIHSPSRPNSPHAYTAAVPKKKRKVIAPVDEKAIGERLKAFRLRRGKTQAEIATTLGVEQSLVSDYERGEVRIHGALVAAFAKVLGVASDEILGLKEPKAQPHVTDRRFLRRLQQIDRLSRRQKDALLTTIDTFLRGSGASPAGD